MEIDWWFKIRRRYILLWIWRYVQKRILRKGKGIKTYKNGDKFVGEWKEDLKNGKGNQTLLLIQNMN